MRLQSRVTSKTRAGRRARGPGKRWSVPFLEMHYTSDFKHNSDSCFLQKLSSDSVFAGVLKRGDAGA